MSQILLAVGVVLVLAVLAWDTLGTHLRNAYTKYDDGQKRLDRLGLQLTQTQADNAEQTALTEGKP